MDMPENIEDLPPQVTKALLDLFAALDAYCLKSQYSKQPIPDTYWKAVTLAYDKAKIKLDRNSESIQTDKNQPKKRPEKRKEPNIICFDEH